MYIVLEKIATTAAAVTGYKFDSQVPIKILYILHILPNKQLGIGSS